MEGKPKISISDFTGMGDKGIYSVDSCKPYTINGRTVMSAGLTFSKSISEDTSGFTGLDAPMSMSFLNYANSNKYGCVIDYANSLYLFGLGGTGTANVGKVYTFPVADFGASYLPDILTTSSGNLLTTHSDYVGVGYFLKVETATSTSLTARKVGVGTDFNFTTAKISTSSGENKVFNITKGQTYTITSIAADITLNFAAQNPVPAVGDYIYVFSSDKFSLGTQQDTRNQHFIGQSTSSDFVRKIIFWNDKYYITNGNYLATIASNEATWTSDIMDEVAKALPTKCQATCMSVNQEKMIVGYEKDGLGGLLLWDGYASGWINRIELDNPVMGVTSFKGGFTFTSGNSIFYTDGYQVQILGSLPDSDSGLTTYFNRTLKTIDNTIYASVPSTSYGRAQAGLWAIDTEKGVFDRLKVSCNFVEKTATYIYAGASFTGATATNCIIILKARDATNYNFTMYVPLGQKTNISTIEINTNIPHRLSNGIPSYSSDITVSYSEGKRSSINNYATVDSSPAPTTTTFNNPNGVGWPIYLGQTVEIKNGNAITERSFVTDVQNGATANELITVSPAFSAAPTAGQSVYVYDLYKTQTRTLTQNSLILTYSLPSFYSDEIYINVSVDTNDVAPDIVQINLY